MSRRLSVLLVLFAGCAAKPEAPEDRVEPPRAAPALTVEPDEVVSDASTGEVIEGGEQAGPYEGTPAGWVAGKPLDFEEIILEWHRLDAREVFLVVEKLVSSRLAFAEADRVGIRLPTELVDAESAAQIARFKADVAAESGGRGVEQFVREVLGVEPEAYWDRIREGVIRQMIAERAVRAWALERENASVRLIVVPDEAVAKSVADELAAGADFAEMARQHSVDESASLGGFVPFIVRQEHSPLARVVFAAAEGEVVGPVPAAGHQFLVRVEERRPALTGGWSVIEAAVEDSLRRSPVDESEFLHWKLEMERAYPVDLGPLLELIGAPQDTRDP